MSLDEKKKDMMMGKYSIKILVYKEKDVKQFIEELKEWIPSDSPTGCTNTNMLIKEIDRLAGKGLI